MKSMSYFIIIIVQIFLLCEITNAKKKESLLATKIDPSTVKFSEVNRKCKAECSKLSKVYPCFCDLSCIEYGDCCKLFAKGCENYFEILLNHKIKQNKNNTTNETEFSLTANKNISKNFKNYTKKEHKNKSLEDFENDGKCCSDGIEPFNCFCDAQCSINGDCCSDYNYCVSHKFLIDKNVKISMRKRKIFDSFFEKRGFNGTQQKNNERNSYQINGENNFSFKHLKKVLYDKFGIKPVNNSSIHDSYGDVNKSSTEKGRLSSKLGLYKVPTLTPQIGMKYIKNEDFQNNENTLILNLKGDKNFKNNSSIEYDNNLMKRAPIAANIYIISQKLE